MWLGRRHCWLEMGARCGILRGWGLEGLVAIGLFELLGGRLRVVEGFLLGWLILIVK